MVNGELGFGIIDEIYVSCEGNIQYEAEAAPLFNFQEYLYCFPNSSFEHGAGKNIILEKQTKH